MVACVTSLWFAVAVVLAEDQVVGRFDGETVDVVDLVPYALAEYQGSSLEQKALEQLIQAALVELEAERRGLGVSDQDVDQRLEALDRQVRKASEGAETLADHLAEQGIPPALFRRLMHQAVACERMIREDFGLPPSAPVPRERQSIWFAEKRLQHAVRQEGLGPGIAAEVGHRSITEEELGRTLFESLPGPDQQQLFDDYVMIQLIKRRAAELDVTVRSEDVTAEIQTRDAELRQKLKEKGLPHEGVTYLDVVKARGGDVNTVLEGDKFRANLLQRLLAERIYGADGYAGFYEHEREYFTQHHGERVQLATIFLRAAEAADAEIPREFSAAVEELEGLRDRLAEDPDTTEETFARLARIYSDHSSRSQGGVLGPLSRSDLTKLELAELDFGSNVGQVLGPVATSHGAHLLLVRGFQGAPSFEELRPALEREARLRIAQTIRQDVVIEWLR